MRWALRGLTLGQLMIKMVVPYAAVGVSVERPTPAL